MKFLFSKRRLLLLGTLLLLLLLRSYFFGDISFSFPLKSGEKVIRETISDSFITPYKQLLEGVLFGLQVRFPTELYEAMKKTGTLHIVVASGYNIAVVAGFCMLLAGVIPRRVAIVLTLAVVFWYTSLSSFDPPVVRAAIMGGLTYIAQLTGRLKQAVWSLVLAAFIMLFLKPSLFFHIGFQLSFAATAGILFLSPLFLSLLEVVPSVIKEEVAVTLSAQLATLPILIYHFQVLSLVALFANLAIAWMIPAVMLFGGLFVATALILPHLAVFFQGVVQGLLAYMLFIIESFTTLPFAQVKIFSLTPVTVVGVYLVIAAGALFLWQKKHGGSFAKRTV